MRPSQIFLLVAVLLVTIIVTPHGSNALVIRSTNLAPSLDKARLYIRQDSDDDDDDDSDNGAADTAGSIGYDGGEQPQQGDTPIGSCSGTYSLDGTCDPEGNTNPGTSTDDSSQDTDSSSQDTSSSSQDSDDSGDNDNDSGSGGDSGESSTVDDDGTATTTTATSTTSQYTSLASATFSTSSASHLYSFQVQWIVGGTAMLMGALLAL